MNNAEKKYLSLLADALRVGDDREDRTGIGTYGLFGKQLIFSLSNNTLPLLTTKKMFTKGIIEELLFFIRGETNTKILEEKGVNIWKSNTSREFLDNRGLTHLPEGDMGKGYGFQWRNFGGTEEKKGTDQLVNLIEGLKNDPYGRRHIITAWNPNQLDEMSLPPCHCFMQFYVSSDNKLSCHLYQRSIDLFLGAPFNIMSYSLLTNILAKLLNMKTGKLVYSMGDAHVYKNHVSQVLEQVEREPYDFPTIEITKDLNTITDIENLELNNFKIENYQYHPSIKAEMAV